MIRFSLPMFTVVVLVACSASEQIGAAQQAAIVGDACVTYEDCAPLNADCIGGVCKGVDSDPCIYGSVIGSVDPAPCAPGFACAPCDPDVFGDTECHCVDLGPVRLCAVGVCLPLFDACATRGCPSPVCDGIDACGG